MKKAVYALLGLVVLVVVAAIALPFLIPAERLKEELILAVSDATGRTLSIDGDFSVSVFPVLGVNASQVSFSNAPTSDEPNMATIDTLTVALSLLPLLSGEVQVDKFVLDKPVIFLESDKAGKKNWEFPKKPGDAEASAKSEDKSDSSDDMADLGLQDLNLGDVQIIDGAVTYSDLKAATKQEISEVNLSLVLKGLDETFKTKGSAVWNAEKIEIDTELGALRAVLENKATTLKASVSSTKVSLTFDGGLGSVTPPSLNGKTDLNVPSLKELTAWIGQPLEGREGTFGLLSIKGNVGVKGDTYSFKNAELAFDKITGTGDVQANLGGKVPALNGTLTIPLLDINPYLPEGSADTAGNDTAAAKPAAANGEKWDSTPIDFSGLKAANANFKLTVGDILIQKMKIGKSSVTTDLQNGVLKIGLTELNLYDGKGSGAVTVNAQGATPTVSKTFTLQGIQLNPLLTDAADFEKLEGTGMITFTMNTAGNSQKDMVSALNGNGKILFENGAIKGINLASMARNVTSAFTDSGEAQKTDFAELSGTFTIVNGLLNNNDLKMLNPFVRLFGKGDVNMPPKTLDYRIEPKLVATTEGQGGKDASGIAVPIKISGSWDDPKFAPDLAGAIKNIADPKALKENLEKKGKDEIGKVLKNGGLGKLFGKD